MKKTFRILICVLLTFVTCFSFVACDSETDEPMPKETPISLEDSVEVLTAAINKTYTLSGYSITANHTEVNEDGDVIVAYFLSLKVSESEISFVATLNGELVCEFYFSNGFIYQNDGGEKTKTPSESTVTEIINYSDKPGLMHEVILSSVSFDGILTQENLENSSVSRDDGTHKVSYYIVNEYLREDHILLSESEIIFEIDKNGYLASVVVNERYNESDKVLGEEIQSSYITNISFALTVPSITFPADLDTW